VASALHIDLFDSIGDATVREERFYNRYRHVIEKSTDAMIRLYLSTADAQMQHYHKQFNDELRQLWDEQRSTRINRKLSIAMLDLIEQRYTNISDRVKFVYNFRVQRLDLNLPI
jgi:hypothetical protein